MEKKQKNKTKQIKKQTKAIRKTIAEDKQMIKFYVESIPILPKRLSLKYFATRSISNHPPGWDARPLFLLGKEEGGEIDNL